MSYDLIFTPKALEGIEKLKKSGNIPLLKKPKKLFVELSDHPFKGTGQPEQLKHEFARFWSRRLNREHRIVYSIDQKIITVTVISVLGHYK
jgi:toxin YoeB